MGDFLILIGFLAMVVAVIAFFRPFPRLGLTTRARAGSLLGGAFIVSMVGAALAPPPDREHQNRPPRAATHTQKQPVISALQFTHINGLFGLNGTLTELQKEHEWDAYKGQCVQWRGTLVHLEEGMWGAFTIGFKHLPHTFTYDVLVTAPRSERARLLSMQKDRVYTYTATLQEYGNILPIQADWGCDG